jgi:hypothetical protein
MRRRARLEVETNSSHWQPVFAHHQPQLRVFELLLSLPWTSHHTLDIENRIGLCGPAQLDLTPWQARETRSLELVYCNEGLQGGLMSITLWDYSTVVITR